MNDLIMSAMRKIAKAGDKLPNGGNVMFDPRDNPEQYLRDIQTHGQRVLKRKYQRSRDIQKRLTPYEEDRSKPNNKWRYFDWYTGRPTRYEQMYQKLKQQRQRASDDYIRINNALKHKIGTPEDMTGRLYMDEKIR